MLLTTEKSTQLINIFHGELFIVSKNEHGDYVKTA